MDNTPRRAGGRPGAPRDDLVLRTELAEIGARLARNIKAWRLERGMTQGHIGRELGVSSVVIHKFETGGIRITIGRLIQLSRALRLPIAALLIGVSPELDDAARLVDPATVRLIRAFARVDGFKTRESIVEGIEQIAKAGAGEDVSRRSRAGTDTRRLKRRKGVRS